MALRLIDAPEPPRPAAHEAVPAARLVPAATARLAAADWAGFRALCAEAGDVADPHRRYEARRALLELALSKASNPAILVAAAAVAVDMLQADPREPVLLNYAGVIFYELGAVKAAQALFAAAQRLDPELPNVERNLAECARRKRAGVRVLPQAAGPIRELQPRVDRIAAAARPAEGLTISLCMIAKDEEAMIARCLQAARDAVEEIIVVDTGSTDRTVEIAESLGARVLHHEWDGDFSAARNVSFEAATGDWVMYLDADEVLVADDVRRLRALAGRTWREAFFLTEINHTGDLEDGTAITHDAMRLFRNRPEYRFEGRIHEQIAQCLPGYLPERQERTTVRVEHFGYLGAVRDTKDKSNRNLELLERQVAEGVDNPFLHFNLGSEYAAVGEVIRALTHFERAWTTIRAAGPVSSDGYAPALASRYVHALRNAGRLDDVTTVGDEVLEVFPGFTDVVLEQALAAGAGGDAERQEALLRRCLEMGDGPSRYSATVGCGTYRPLVVLAEVLRRRGAVEEAEDMLRDCLREHPGFLAAVDPYAGLMLRRGVPAAEVVETVHALVADSSPSMRFLLAVSLSEAGAVAEAEAELRAVVAAQPANAHARVALAETLLAQGRFADAAAEAASVDPEAPCAAAAQRTELFALLTDGTSADTRAAVALPDEERAVFAAWEAVRSGAGAPAALPAPAAAPVLIMLDALARLQAFDAFEALVAVLEAVAMPWRERRQALAELYLRHGYADSAAEEWIAACEQGGVDALALRGLAAVAVARGLDEDAKVFAAEADALAAA
ncbi:MAG TPA: glycosyltransferase family 2 protein [Solirubrobacteraceae bacterium]|nr:glycosyltransferase family 2 protein [Solirubrobacteraceae bacterium]